MADEKILLFGKAKRLGIENYRKMSIEDLKTAIATAEKPAGKPAKGKGKTAANGSASEPAATEAVARAKGRTTPKKSTTARKGRTTTAPARKSTARKTTAKRSSAASGAAKRQSVKRHPAASPKRASAVQGARIVKTKGTRVFLDKSKIDWKAESNVGKKGKRKEVLDALRKYKGDYDKCFDALAPRAKKFYPGKTKAQAESLLTWLTARVAYDFAMSINGHKPGTRRAYGTANGDRGTTPKRKTASTSRKQRPVKRGATARR